MHLADIAILSYRAKINFNSLSTSILGEESSGGQSVMLRTAAGYEEAANFLKQSL